ncbi:MAG: acyltransferase [Desulfamplus sp.]|nr:acyltransferase [Desulfamplus sp.]
MKDSSLSNIIRTTGAIKRLDYLDTVRGFAALAVLWSHFALGFGLPGGLMRYENTPLQIFWDGLAGVSMFFVLSGFVLSLKYFNPDIENTSVSSGSDRSRIGFDANEILKFCVKRIFRILPPFLAVLILSILAFQYLYIVYPTDPNRSVWIYSLWKDMPISIYVLLKQALLILPGTVQTFVPQAWSLTLEMQLSLMMPFLISLAYRSMAFFTVLAVLLSVADILSVSFLGVEASVFLVSLFHFYLGILISKYYRDLNLFICKSTFFLKLTIISAGLLLYSFRSTVFPWYSEFFPAHMIPYFNAFGAMLILLSCMGSRTIQYVLNVPCFNFVGKISYSLYLCHIVVLIIITPCFIKWMNQIQIIGVTSHLFALIFSTATSFIIAVTFYYLVEKPSIKSGIFVVKWIESVFFMKRAPKFGRSLV